MEEAKIENQVLSQAFTLSHDSYATIRSNFKRNEHGDFFLKRKNQRVQRLMNQLSSSPTNAKYGSARQFQNMKTITSSHDGALIDKEDGDR